MEKQRGRRAVVLLVDDDLGDQELTRRAIEKDVIKTDLYTVNDGEEALDYLNQTGAFSIHNAPRPDLVLLDLNLPKLGGREVLKRIRSDERLQRIPVVILTTSQQEEDIIRSYDLGCNSFICKPIEVEPFIQTIRVLGRYWFELVVLPSEVMA